MLIQMNRFSECVHVHVCVCTMLLFLLPLRQILLIVEKQKHLYHQQSIENERIYNTHHARHIIDCFCLHCCCTLRIYYTKHMYALYERTNQRTYASLSVASIYSQRMRYKWTNELRITLAAIVWCECVCVPIYIYNIYQDDRKALIKFFWV